MEARSNKQLMQEIFSALEKGDGKPFIDSLADDFSWTVPGTTKWSRTYRGKQVVLDELFGPLFARFATPYTNTAQRFIADGDYVAVQCQGKVTTRKGMAYNNHYCYVCLIKDGKLQALEEYLDTELVNTALGDPAIVETA